ncbi:MAG: MFS transporter [Cucumibacter sp.]
MAAPAPTLKLSSKLAYGFGDVTGAVIAAVYGFYMQAFLLDVAGLAPATAGIIFAIAQFWDAVTDPAMGRISDLTRSRWGRRRPYLLFGAVPLGLAFFLHWLVPPFGPETLFFYYLVVALLMRTAFTVVSIPYTALTPDLAPDHDGRTQLNLYRFVFSIFGGLAAVILHPVIVASAGDVYVGHMLSAGVWFVVIVVSTLTCFAFTRERPEHLERVDTAMSYGKRLAIVLGNRPYLIATGIYLLSWLALQFIQANLLLYARYWLDAEAQFTSYVAVLQVTAAAFLFVWTFVSARAGKKATYVAGISVWIAVLIGLFFVQPGQAWLLYGVAFLAGIGLSAAYLIPWSMLPDTIEHNELMTGERQEGLFYGFFVFLQKLGLSVGLGLSGWALGEAGYLTPAVEGGELQLVAQPDSVLLTLRIFVSFVPAVVLLLSIPLALAYPISKARHEEIVAALEKRKSAG